MTDTADVVVADAPERDRYEAHVAGELAGWSEYHVTPQMLVFTHTEVQPAFEGRGVGSALARYALDDVRCRGLRALAVCPFVLGWIRRHPAYADLEYRSRTRADVD
ncbi:GNAT family N-acetyltransferase [Aquipuribacter sp. MA13-6]|uniref:GNAT family N-acetyltransferase n=1 Tax=unclassified Aquipuribacter TaxID=2635084 RepID=UPI003EEDF67F